MKQGSSLEKIPEEDNFENIDMEEDLLPPSMTRSISVPISKGQDKTGQ